MIYTHHMRFKLDDLQLAASVGADKVEIADGDSIEWKYYKDASKAM